MKKFSSITSRKINNLIKFLFEEKGLTKKSTLKINIVGPLKKKPVTFLPPETLISQ